MFKKSYVHSRVLKMLKDERGMGEYGVLVAFMSVALIVGLGLFSGVLQNIFADLTNALKGVSNKHSGGGGGF